MTTQNISLFRALGGKMDFLNHRQRVIAQNVSNADTPNYKPKDLVAVDFSTQLDNVLKGRKSSVNIARTSDGHMTPDGRSGDPKAKKMKETYEVAPAGNAVIMEEQLINAGQTVMDYNLMSSVYQKNIGMLKTALGRQR